MKNKALFVLSFVVCSSLAVADAGQPSLVSKAGSCVGSCVSQLKPQRLLNTLKTNFDKKPLTTVAVTAAVVAGLTVASYKLANVVSEQLSKDEFEFDTK